MKNIKKRLWPGFFLGIILLAAGCGGCGRKEESSQKDDAGTLKYATLLRLDERDGCTVASITDPWDTTRLLARYVLLEKGAKVPDDARDAVIIDVPLKSAVLYSAVHGGVIEELGAMAAVKGVAEGKYFKTPRLRAVIDKGLVADLGQASGLPAEKLLALNPDAILQSIYEGMDQQQFDNPRLKVIKFADNLEETALGRAEWIKFIGSLTGTRDKADSIFTEVERRYNELRGMVPKGARRPTVLVENMYEGIWYVPGGKSYQARIIDDAGGDYLWKDDNRSGSLNLSFEQVLQKGRDADIWLLKVYGQDLTKESLLRQDARYRFFKAVDGGGVYFSNTDKKPLFDEFPYHPERLLEDYIGIFYPQMPKGLRARYFEKMRQ